eukprot:72344-Pyramimonas_sp.AAC.1
MRLDTDHEATSWRAGSKAGPSGPREPGTGRHAASCPNVWARATRTISPRKKMACTHGLLEIRADFIKLRIVPLVVLRRRPASLTCEPTPRVRRPAHGG